MSFTEIKTRLKATIWQAVAQSGVDLSGLPQAEQDKLVAAITDGLLPEVDDILSEASGKPTAVNFDIAPTSRRARRCLLRELYAIDAARKLKVPMPHRDHQSS